jgi:hypothetical protein
MELCRPRSDVRRLIRRAIEGMHAHIDARSHLGPRASTTGFQGFADSTLLSAEAIFLSAQAVPRGNSQHNALGTAGPAKSPLPRATSDPLVTRVPGVRYCSRQMKLHKTKKAIPRQRAHQPAALAPPLPPTTTTRSSTTTTSAAHHRCHPPAATTTAADPACWPPPPTPPAGRRRGHHRHHQSRRHHHPAAAHHHHHANKTHKEREGGRTREGARTPGTSCLLSRRGRSRCRAGGRSHHHREKRPSRRASLCANAAVDVKSAPYAKHTASRTSWLHTREDSKTCQSIFPEN